jgi:hypothetical protein
MYSDLIMVWNNTHTLLRLWESVRNKEKLLMHSG